MIVVGVSGTIFVIVMVLGVLAYLHDGAMALKRRQQRRAVREQLASDLATQQAPPSLPYGYSAVPPASDADQQQ